ncbi:helix-turn-helix domain-containing protein [Chitinibacter tainanensis]|uniref:helix-turn-helix domain-containing protein n=1 Tax=Chitinibacter tainanensis TaxID=230667 RepID=UPI0003F53F22|nr:AraC family transcriptional regulator [Chitinibacter tainanensis]
MSQITTFPRGLHTPELRHLQPLYPLLASRPEVLQVLESRFGLRRVEASCSDTMPGELALQLHEYLHAAGAPHILVQVAAALDLGAGNGLLYFLRSANTVAQAVNTLVQLGPLSFPDGSLTLILTETQFTLQLRPLLHAERLGMLLRYEAICVWLARLLEHLLAEPQPPLAAALMTQAVQPAELAPHLPHNLSWQAPAFALSWPIAQWQRPLPNASASLWAALQPHFLAGLQAQQAADTLAQRTCRYLLPGERLRLAEQETVAKALGLSVAQYRRQLAAEQTSFSRLVLELKRRAAVQYLVGEQRLEDIASALGFAERSAFERAFVGWYGCTPAQFRRAAQQGERAAGFMAVVPAWQRQGLATKPLSAARVQALAQVNPKLACLLLAELNQAENGALGLRPLAEVATLLPANSICDVGYASLANADEWLESNTPDLLSAALFLRAVAASLAVPAAEQEGIEWAAQACLLASTSLAGDLAHHSRGALVLLAQWGMPAPVVRRLGLWSRSEGAGYAELSAALAWLQARTPPAAADSRWPALWAAVCGQLQQAQQSLSEH